MAESIDHSVVLFPVVTPLYFSSASCREEILAFEKRQTKVERDDLILPIYYLFSEMMDDLDGVSTDETKVAELLKRIQFEDWRAFRQTEETDPAYVQAIERLAQRAVPALKRGLVAVGATDAVPATPRASERLPEKKEADVADTSAQEMQQEVGGEDIKPGYVATVTVDQMPGRAEFTSISEALARSAAGARVLVRPGHYREELIINKPLELVGDGPREDIVVEASDGHTIVFDTNIGLLRGLTVRQSGIGRFYAVWIKQGRLALEDCDLAGASSACLAVSSHADPRVRRNVIHSAKQSGVFVSGNARGSYEDNDIFGNGLSRFAVNEAEPIVRRNRIHDNQQSGIHIYSNAFGTFEENDVLSNGYAGLAVRKRAEPIVRRNRIHDNQRSGIRIYDDGRGTYEDNEILGNGYSGFSVSRGAEPIVRRNRINQNRAHGLYVYENGRGTYEDNEVLSNEYAGVHAASGGAPVLRRNRINKNRYEGVWVNNTGGGLFENNDLRENTRGPWDIEESASAELKRDRNIEH